jgi:intracellular septation protein A
MLSKSDQRFLKEWDIQMKGSSWLYLLLNAFIFSLFIYLLGIAINYVFDAFKWESFNFIMGLIAVVSLGTLISFLLYYRNRSKYFEIRLKEKDGTTN